MFNIIDTTEHFIFDPIKKVLSKISAKPTVAMPEPQENPINTYQSIKQYPQKEIESAKQAIKYMETRGEKNPYSFSQPSGVKELGEAMGAYQITEAKLKENAKKFLGRNVSKQEFLNNPELQDKFVESEIKYLKDNNFKIDSLFSAHRGGWSDMSRQATINRNNKYKEYMNQATQKYNEILNNL